MHVGHLKRHVRDAARRPEHLRLKQHLDRQIRRGYFADTLRNRKCRMPGTGRDIQGGPMRFGRRKRNDPGQDLMIGVSAAGGIVCGPSAENAARLIFLVGH